MEVCHLINSLEHGGAETHLLEMVEAAEGKDISFTVCSLERSAPLESKFRDAGVETVNFGAMFKFDPRALGRMFTYLRNREFDILHTHLPLAHSIGRPIGRLAGVETVVSTQHNVVENYHPITGTLEKVTRPLDTRTIAVSQGVRDSFAPSILSEQNWEVIYNGIDVEAYNAKVTGSNPENVRERHNISNETVFLNIARYHPQKAQRDLIGAMEYVTDEIRDVRLLMVGSGELEADLREQVHSAGLEDHVTLTGHVPSVLDYYAVADVFVSSSVREGLPITLLEAMAAELPVVATNIPGVNEVVADGETGRLVPPNDPRELSDAVFDLIGPSRQREYGQAGYDRVRTHFDITQTLDAHIELYEELLGGTDPARDSVAPEGTA